jgi:hypothetical protein
MSCCTTIVLLIGGGYSSGDAAWLMVMVARYGGNDEVNRISSVERSGILKI